MANVQEQIKKLKAQTETVQTLITLGDLYLEQKDKVEARHHYLEAVEKFPQSFDGFLRMGQFTLNNGDLDEANNYLGDATAIDPKCVDAWIAYAKTHFKLGGLQRADEYINRALDLSPENTEALMVSGMIKLNTGNAYYAKQHLEKAEADKNSPFAPLVKFLLGSLYAQQTVFQKAEEKFKAIEKAAEFQDLNSVNGLALQNNMALTQFGLGKPDLAEKILVDLTSKSKIADASTWINLAMAYWIQDKTEDAVRCFEKANQLTPGAWPWVAETKDYLATGSKGLAEKIDHLKKESPEGKNVGLYLGCVIPNRYPYVEAATRHVLDYLNVGVADLEGAGCCPAPGVFRSFDINTWMTLGARNIVISEEQNRDLVTMCNGCYGTLNDINDELHHDKAKKEMVNSHLNKIGKDYKGNIKVEHLVELLYYDIGTKKIKEKITNPFKDLKIAIHLGCHIVKPHKNKPWDSSFEAPHFLTELVEVTGAKAINYKDELMCCGAGGGVRSNEKEISLDFTREKLENMRAAGVDAIVLCCPFCELQFDLGQTEVNSIFKEKNTAPFNYPVIYISQLIGLAMGLDPYRLGILRAPKPKGVPPFQPMESMFTRLKHQIDV